MICGGEKDSLNGPMSPRRSHSLKDIDNHICRVILASMIYVCAKQDAIRSRWLNSMAWMDFATTITGSPASGYWIFHWMTCLLIRKVTCLFVCAGLMKTGRVVGMGPIMKY